MDIKNVVQKGRKDFAAKFKARLDQGKYHLEGRDAVHEHLIKASETRANYELLDEIIKGENDDLRAEFAVKGENNDLHAEFTVVSLDKVLLQIRTCSFLFGIQLILFLG